MAGRDLPTGTITFLFTDIEGSTRLLQRLGEGYRAVQDAHAEILRAAIAAGGGLEVRTEGDSFFAVFPAPAGSVRATVAAQRGLASHPWPDGVELRIRAGLHTGEGVLGGDDYLGLDVNRAARIAAAAHGGQVLVSASTRALVELDLPDGVRLRDVGPHRLKDLEHIEHLFDLVIEGLPSAFPPPASLDARPHNLPPQRTSFVGRGRQVEDLVGRLRPGTVLTLTGPGGVGKTRLALQVAGAVLPRFADGACLVELSSVVDPGQVPRAIGGALRVREDPERSVINTLTDHLSDRELLLILDNFEQVLDAAELVADLRTAARRCAFLVTSRSPLHLYGEQESPVEPLSVPRSPDRDGGSVGEAESVELFADRARLADPGFRLDDATGPLAAEICARVDGLPLAIELAASRVNLLSLREILERLRTSLSLLTVNVRDLPERQRALYATIDWSYGLLTGPERILFARMSVFRGGATIESVEAVVQPPGDLGVEMLDGLSSLVDKSLLRRGEVDGESRFDMLSTIRQYADERLRDDGTADDVALRHAAFLADLSERAEVEFVGEDQAAWQDRFEREHDNLRAALRWSIGSGRPEPGLRIGAAIWRFWEQRGHLSEAREWLHELLAMPEAAAPTAIRGRAVSAAGGLAYWSSDLDEAERWYLEGLEIARSTGDAVALFDATNNLAYVPWLRGDVDRGWALLGESLAMARQLGDKRRIAQTASGFAYATVMRGDFESALPINEEAIALAREVGDRTTLADGVETVAQIHRMLGNHRESRAAFHEALELKHEAGNIPGILTSLFMLSALESELGRYERSVRLFGAASSMLEAFNASPPPPVFMMGDPVGAARGALPEEVVDRALDEGGRMDVDAAVAYACESDASAP